MITKLWPSGHSDNYTTVVLFKDAASAARKHKRIERYLEELGGFCNGINTVPFRVGNAFFADYELDQNDEARDAQDVFGEHAEALGGNVRILEYPHDGSSSQFKLLLAFPDAEEIPILNKAQLDLIGLVAKNIGTGVGRLFGSTVPVRCTVPRGHDNRVYLLSTTFVDFTPIPIKLFESTFRKVVFSTPVGDFKVSERGRGKIG